MGWSPTCAANAYLDTLKLCKADGQERRQDSPKSIELESNEFLSALAAGMSAQLIVEVSTEASNSTIALAAAARQTGGRLVCILPEVDALEESKEVIKESGLNDMVEFKVGDPYQLLLKYENIDFSLVDCKTEANTGLLELLDVNPKKSVVVASNLDGGREGLCGKKVRGVKGKAAVRSRKHPIGNGMEVTMIGESDELGRLGGSSSHERKDKAAALAARKRPSSKSMWEMKVDENGEEHIFRVPNPLHLQGP